MTLYLPGNSIWHRLPAGGKLALLAALGVLLSFSTPLWVLLVLLLAVLGIHLHLGQAAWRSVAWLLSLWPFFVVTLGFHLWQGAWQSGLLVVLRLALAFLAANLVTMTTRLDDMLHALTPILSPLSVLGLPPRKLALALALLIRFAPQVQLDHQQLSDAWRARSVKNASWRLLPALFVLTLKNADQLGEALAARGGSQGFNRSEKP